MSGNGCLTPHCAVRKPPVRAASKRLGVDCLDLYLLHWQGNVPCRKRSKRSSAFGRRGKSATGASATWTRRICRKYCDQPDGHRVACDRCSTTCRAVASNGICPGARTPDSAHGLFAHRTGAPAAPFRPPRPGTPASMTPSATGARLAAPARSAVAIPRTSTRVHLEENCCAAMRTRCRDALAELDRMFPPPRRRAPLSNSNATQESQRSCKTRPSFRCRPE